MKKITLLDLIIKKFNLEQKTAVGLILSGKVLVNNQVVSKTGMNISENDDLRIKETSPYVSRGAYKLLSAFDAFFITVKDRICLDVGCSTGGFTQVLLEKGARKVYSVDCGNNVLHYKLRNHPGVEIMENRNIHNLTIDNFQEKIDLAVMDVSFCSSLPIIYHIYQQLKIANIVSLIKPQFEYKRLKEILNLSSDFKGVVKHEEDQIKIIDYIKNEIIELGLKIIGIIPSNIKGTKGNREYLFYIQ